MIRLRTLRHGLRRESGAQLVEFAMVAPILLMVVASIADFGLLFRTAALTANAVREGARLAALPGNEDNNYEAPRARVANYLAEVGAAGAATVTFTQEDVEIAPGTLAGGVRVTINYTHTTLFLSPIVAFMGGSFAGTLPIQSSVFMRTQIAATAAAGS